MPISDLSAMFARQDSADLIAQAQAPRVGDYISPPEDYAGYAFAAPAANTLFASLFLLQRRMRFDRIAIYVHAVGVAGAAARLGIYNVDWITPPTWYPSSLILDAGVVDCTIPGNRTITIDQVLDKGWYTFAMVTNDATIQFRHRAYALSPRGYPESSLVTIPTWSVAQAYGALPDPYPAGAGPYIRDYGALRVAELL